MRGNQKQCIDGAQTSQWSTYKGQAGDREHNGQHIKDKQGTDNTMVNI